MSEESITFEDGDTCILRGNEGATEELEVTGSFTVEREEGMTEIEAFAEELDEALHDEHDVTVRYGKVVVHGFREGVPFHKSTLQKIAEHGASIRYIGRDSDRDVPRLYLYPPFHEHTGPFVPNENYDDRGDE